MTAALEAVDAPPRSGLNSLMQVTGEGVVYLRQLMEAHSAPPRLVVKIGVRTARATMRA